MRASATLEHKVALVTGGASGIGKAIAERLKSDGAAVVITDVQARLGEAVATGLGCEFLAHDVTSESGWSQVIGEVQRRHAGLHILVNNAGIVGSEEAGLEQTQLDQWQKVFAVNVEGVFLGCRAAIPAIHVSGGGSIVNISSIAGLMATPYAIAYGASKAAVRQLTKSIAQHCAERKLRIRCNSVHPGVVRTPLWEERAVATAGARGVPLETLVSEAERSVPLGNFTLPRDVAAAVAFLVGEESRHVTGAKLIVDGGFVACDTYQLRRVEAR